MEMGAYYTPYAYAKFSQRLSIMAIDGVAVVVLAAASGALAAALSLIPGMDVAAVVFGVVLAFAVAWFYLIELPRGAGTLGLRTEELKIVDITGARPTRSQLLLRLGSILLGPPGVLADTLWAYGDEQGQAVRDKLARTYVVRAQAQPRGYGPIRGQMYFFLGAAAHFPEVERSPPTRPARREPPALQLNKIS